MSLYLSIGFRNRSSVRGIWVCLFVPFNCSSNAAAKYNEIEMKFEYNR